MWVSVGRELDPPGAEPTLTTISSMHMLSHLFNDHEQRDKMVEGEAIHFPISSWSLSRIRINVIQNSYILCAFNLLVACIALGLLG